MYFVITVFQIDGKYQMRFDMIAGARASIPPLPINLVEEALERYSLNSDNAPVKEAGKILRKVLNNSTKNIFQSEPLSPYTLNGNLVNTITYTLPDNPYLAYIFFCCFSGYLNSHSNKFKLCLSKTNDLHHSQPITTEQFINVLDCLWNGGIHSGIEEILQELSKFNDEKNSINILNKVDYFYRAYKEIKLEKLTTASTSLDVMRYKCHFLWADIINPLLNPEEKTAKKLDILFNTITQFLHENKQSELNFMLECLAFYAKLKLLTPCIDNQKYKRTSSEYLFILEAQFTLQEDGLMVITNFHDNQIYKKNYAPDKPYHENFEKDISLLAASLGLQFENNSAFHEKMIFTRLSTNQLKANGLHYNEISIKNLLKARNSSRFFKPSEFSDTIISLIKYQNHYDENSQILDENELIIAVERGKTLTYST